MPNRSAEAALAAALLALAVHAARAASVDPTLPATVAVGPAPGLVDPAGSGRSRDPLPAHPVVVARGVVRGGVAGDAIAVDASGHVTVAAAESAEVVELDARGAEVWRAPTGASIVVAGPVLASGGTRAVLTGAGVLRGWSRAGRERLRADLGGSVSRAHAALVPLADGVLAAATGADVTLVDGDGRVLRRERLAARVAGLVADDAGALAVDASGEVRAIATSGDARVVARLGGAPSGGLARHGATVAAVVDHRRLVVVDRSGGPVRTLLALPQAALDGPPTWLDTGAWLVSTFAGELVAFDAAGVEIARVAVDARRAAPRADAGAAGDILAESPRPLVDAAGHVVFARAGGRVGAVASLAPGALPGFVAEPACAAPLALAPAGPGRAVVACREGTVLILGEAP